MGKKIIIFLFAFVFMFGLTFISADKVLTQTNTEGLQIFYPDYMFVKQNSMFYLHLHVANVSNGFPFNNTQVDCRLHLYNTTGHHTFESPVLTKDSNGYDHKIYLNQDGGNFSDLGVHAFYIWCNRSASGLGGEARGTFMVTSTGEGLTQQIATSYIGLLAILVFLFLVSMGAIGFLDGKRFKTGEDGGIIDEGNVVYLKPVLYVIGYAVLMAIFFVSSNFALAYLNFEMFGQLFFTIYKVMMYLALPLFVVWIIVIFVRIFQDREYKNMIERGVGVGDI